MDGSGSFYTLTPEDVGLPRRQYEDIAATGDTEAEATRFLQTLAGVEKGACEEITSMNAGAIFYLTDRVSTLRDGVAKARDSIRTGDLLRKLVEWITIQSDASGQGIERLKTVSGRAGLETRVTALL